MYRLFSFFGGIIMIEIELERLLKDAKADPDLKIALLKTRAGNNPV